MFSLPVLDAKDIMVGTTGKDSANVRTRDAVEVEINLVNTLVRRQMLGLDVESMMDSIVTIQEFVLAQIQLLKIVSTDYFIRLHLIYQK